MTMFVREGSARDVVRCPRTFLDAFDVNWTSFDETTKKHYEEYKVIEEAQKGRC